MTSLDSKCTRPIANYVLGACAALCLSTFGCSSSSDASCSSDHSCAGAPASAGSAGVAGETTEAGAGAGGSVEPSAGSGGKNTVAGSGGMDSSSDGGTSSAGATQNNGGAPTGSWVDVTSNLTGVSSECGTMTNAWAKPDEDMIIAGIALKGLWASTNGGTSWTQLGSGAGSATITNRPSWLVFDPDHPKVFYESGIYNGIGAYITSDDGKTFQELGAVAHNDAIGVDFTDPARKTLLATGHEQKQTLYRSTDAGATWKPAGMAIPAGTNYSSNALVLDAQTYLVGCAGFGGGTSGIYRTMDGGGSWSQVSALAPFLMPLLASDGSIYWSLDQASGMVRSTDKGLTWKKVAGAGVIASAHPVELPDGRIATLGPQTVMISADRGATWSAASTALPFGDSIGVIYSKQEKAFFVWHAICGVPPLPVPVKSIVRFDFDYESN